MTQDQLEDQHIQAVRDVLSIAVLALEEPIYQSMVPPTRAPHRAQAGLARDGRTRTAAPPINISWSQQKLGNQMELRQTEWICAR